MCSSYHPDIQIRCTEMLQDATGALSVAGAGHVVPDTIAINKMRLRGLLSGQRLHLALPIKIESALRINRRAPGRQPSPRTA